MKLKQYKFFTGSLKALSDDTRVDIVLFLATGEKCVCKIYKNLKLPQNLVSHHLAILRQSGLITSRKDGKWVYYSLSRKSIKEIQSIFTEIVSIKENISKCR